MVMKRRFYHKRINPERLFFHFVYYNIRVYQRPDFPDLLIRLISISTLYRNGAVRYFVADRLVFKKADDAFG